jgi:hypothetical protein
MRQRNLLFCILDLWVALHIGPPNGMVQPPIQSGLDCPLGTRVSAGCGRSGGGIEMVGFCRNFPNRLVPAGRDVSIHIAFVGNLNPGIPLL